MNAQGAQGVCCRPLPSRPDQGLRRAAVGAVFSGRSRTCGILLSRLLPQTAYAQVPLWWVYYHVRLHCPRGGRPSALPPPAGRQPRIRGNRKDIEPRATHTRSRVRRGYWGRRRQYWENTGLFYSRGDRGDPGRPLICKLPHPAAHTHSQTLHKKHAMRAGSHVIAPALLSIYRRTAAGEILRGTVYILIRFLTEMQGDSSGGGASGAA